MVVVPVGGGEARLGRRAAGVRRRHELSGHQPEGDARRDGRPLRHRGRLAAAEPAEFGDDLVEPLAADELHGVEVRAVVLADAEDRDDVGVVQPGGGPRLHGETLQLRRASHLLPGQDLQGDVPAERLLDRLVDDAHAAPADLAEDRVVAQPPRVATEVGDPPGALGDGLAAVDGEVLLELDQRRQDLADLLGDLGVSGRVVVDARPLAAPEALEERLGHQVDRVAVGVAVGHGQGSWRPPGMAARTSLRRSRARAYRLLAADLSRPSTAATSPLESCS